MTSYDHDTRPRRTHAPNFHGHKISNHSSSSSPSEGGSEIGQKEKLRKEDNSLACRFREHVKLGPKISETVKGKLQLGAKIIQGGGRKNLFIKLFGITEGERMLKASQCYLSTKDDPIAGLLFISTEKVAFCSQRPVTVPSPTGQFISIPYKVVIPVSKIQRASRSENKENPAQKFIEIVTEDNESIRFMGFLRYEKAFRKLQEAVPWATRS